MVGTAVPIDITPCLGAELRVGVLRWSNLYSVDHEIIIIEKRRCIEQRQSGAALIRAIGIGDTRIKCVSSVAGSGDSEHDGDYHDRNNRSGGVVIEE